MGKLITQKLNTLKKEISYNLKREHCFGEPFVFAIETTNRCNLNCIMCPRCMMKRKVGDMDIELFKKIVDDASKYTSFLWLHHFGDPLLHPKIDEMIAYCKKRGIKTGISTNAVVLTESISRKIINSGLDWILLSFDGYSKETYEKYRAGGKFEIVKRNINNFLRIKKEMGSKLPKVSIKMINMKGTNKEIEQFKKEWTGKADEILITKFIDWAGQIGNEENISGAIIQKQKFPCKWFWSSMVVLWDGRVVPCCKDYDGKMVLGDLTKQTIKEVWNSKRFKDIRRQQLKGKFDNALCKNCDEAIGRPSPFFVLDLMKRVI